MRPNRQPRLIFLAGAVGCSLAMIAGAQEADELPPSPSPFEAGAAESVEEGVGALLDAFDLTPKPVPEIPDNPPPHEGAMVDMPEYRVGPTDMLLVEVLEALPGRPISGERLVQSDGMISLGFYGDIHVRGLTLQQVKVKIIKHLRRHLSDDVLGLLEPVYASELPDEAKQPPQPEEAKLDEPAGATENASKPREIRIQAGEGVSIRIEVTKESEPEPNEPPMGWETDPYQRESIIFVPAPPELSDRIFVAVTAYNSKNYYVLGDIGAPGRLPVTGNETVLDALQFSGGLLPTANPDDIRLVRPGRDGKPGRVYKVDLEAIQDRGETTTNYQIFPGDRLVIGRDKAVEKTARIGRIAAPIQTIVATIQREAEMNQALSKAYISGDVAKLKEAVEFWVREMNRPGGVVLDDEVLRDALIQGLPVQPAKPERARDGD